MGDSSDLSDLNLSRQGDRVKLASRLVDLAQSLGATAELKLECSGQREVRVSIRAARGLGLDVSIRRPAKGPIPASFVLPWCLDGTDPHARLTHEFGEVNPYHRRKATHVAWSVSDLMDQVCNGLSMARDGSAFEGSQTPASEDVSLPSAHTPMGLSS